MARHIQDMSDKKGHRTMTLADFIKVFDFEYSNMEISYYGDNASNTYFSKAEVERDYCAAIYTVLYVRSVNESTVRVVIWQ